jgi:hypothetical protein
MAMKKLGPNKDKGMKADTMRKTKQAQSMGMSNIKAKRSVAADAKRKTAEAINVLGKKKAASSYALGLKPASRIKPSPKKP